MLNFSLIHYIAYMAESFDILSRFKAICTERDLIHPGDFIIAAISGGPDSTALLDLMTRWQGEGGYFQLVAAHYNHKLRAESDAEQKFVEEACSKLGVECANGWGEVATEANRRKISVHAAAREMRYDFLVETAGALYRQNKPAGHCVVLTAHHRDDQVETVLMRLIEGSDVSGLGGIRRIEVWKGHDNILIVRPLLDFTRADIEAYLHWRGLDYVTDRSNADLNYPRNRLRHKVIPALVEMFGEPALSGIARCADFAQQTSGWLDATLDDALRKSLIERYDDEVILDYTRFSSYINLMQLKILQRSTRLLNAHGDRIKNQRFWNTIHFLSSSRRGAVELGADVHARRWKDKVYIFRSEDSDWQRLIQPGETVDIPGFGSIEVSIFPRRECVLPPPEGIQYCDLDRLGAGPYRVRPALPGDRFTPYGMTGQRKVSDILREAGLPPHRRHYPVVVSGLRIAVVPPFRVAHEFKLTDTTEQVVAFRFSRREKMIHSKDI